MAFQTGQSAGFKADINVTPLVDVVLVLLIIFMVVTPLIDRGRDLDLPKAHYAMNRPQPTQAQLVLNITPDGGAWLDARRISESQLEKLAKERKDRARYLEVLLRADSRVSVKALRPILGTLKRAGITQISFAVLEADGAQ